jgi:peptide/nickel transport system substrate-binding protein
MDRHLLLGSGRVSRRAFIRRAGAAGAGLAALGLAACGGDDGGSGQASDGERRATAVETAVPSEVKPGGLMKVVWETEPQGTMDPHKVAGGFSRPMQAAIFEGFLFKPAGKPAVGMLAEAWETPDPTTFIFKLRQGVKFQDGSAVSAELAKWNMERSLGTGFINEGGYKGAAKGLTTIEAVNESTIRCTFNQAKVDSLSAFYFIGQNSLTGMASREAVTRLGDRFDRQPVGSGPFILKEWVSDTRMSYDRFPEYWQKDDKGRALPYLDNLQFVSIPDPNVGVVALQRGEVHALMVSPQQALQLESDKSIDLFRRLTPTNIMYFNHSKPPFNNLHLRRAVAFGIKRDEVAKTAYFNQARANGGGFSEDGDWHDKDFKGQTYDANVVRQSLAAGGMPNGFSFGLAVLPTGPRKTAAELIQAQLKEFGINVELQLMESNEYVQRGLNRGELDSIIAGAGTAGLDETPSGLTSLLQPPWRIVPTPEQAKPGLDIYAKMQTEFDTKARFKLHQEFAQWYWLDFIVRAEVFDEAKIAAQRHEFGGYDWYGSAPQGVWNRAFQRA